MLPSSQQKGGGELENFLVKKLSAVAQLDAEDCRAIEEFSQNIRSFERGQEIIGEGERPDYLHLMIDGWSARYKTLRNGARQIVGFLIPGDFCDLHVQILGAMDHTIQAMNDCKVAFIPSEQFEKLTSHGTKLTQALWWTTLVDEAVLREWVLNTGRREAYEAAAHLMCEMHFRMDQVGLVEKVGEFSLPLTQEELGDALGISPVHLSRVLKRLRDEDLISFRSKLLTIHDLERLRKAAGFDATYMHIEPQRNAAT
jgi:CRP-like cAMP-binding protein